MDNHVKDFLYEKESYQIIDAAKNVWLELGGSFKEKIAERAFIIALTNIGLSAESQKRINVYYDGKMVGTYVPDIIVGGVILVELKCKEYIAKGDIQQLWHYLKATNYKLGFVINFSPSGVQFKRVVYDKARIIKN